MADKGRLASLRRLAKLFQFRGDEWSTDHRILWAESKTPEEAEYVATLRRDEWLERLAEHSENLRADGNRLAREMEAAGFDSSPVLEFLAIERTQGDKAALDAWPKMLAALERLHIQLGIKADAGPQQGNAGDCVASKENYPDPDSHDRDKWIFEQMGLGTTNDRILQGTNRPGWNALLAENSLRAAAKRYAAHFGLDMPKRPSGRPSKRGKKTPQTPQ